MKTQILIPVFVIGFLAAAGLTFFFIRWAVRWFLRRRQRKLAVSAELAKLEAFLPDSCFIEVEGVRLHYVQAGRGRDIVLLHGIGASVFIWRYLFPLLQIRYRVTALDLAGFGQSAKSPDRDYGLDAQTDLVAKALERLEIRSPLLIGSSMGGAITLWLAKTFPNRFPKAIVLSPATDSSIIPTQVRHLATAAPYLKKVLNRRTMRLILERVLSRRDLITDEVIDAYLTPFRDEEGHAIRAFWSATSLLSDRRLPRDLHDIQGEVLIVYGERDFMVSRRSMHRLLKIIPHSRLVTHPQGGHHIMEDEPSWVASVITEFLRS